MKKEFKENLSSYFNDGIGMHGEVELIDLNNNKVLFKKHNMIVQDGRNFIRDLFLKQLAVLSAREGKSNSHNAQTFLTNLSLQDPSNASLTKVKFGSSSNATKLEMPDLEEAIEDLEFSIVDDVVEEKLNRLGDKVESYQIKVKVNLNNEYAETYVLGELGLFYEDQHTEYMFSRVAFDPIIVGAGSSLQLTYYIYF